MLMPLRNFMNNRLLYTPELDALIDLALKEDIRSGDITGNAIFSEAKVNAQFLVKAGGVIAGLPLIEMIYTKKGGEVEVELLSEDGDAVQTGDIVARIRGGVKEILAGERTVLNFLQRMSGIATKTAHYIEAMGDTETKLLDTRKTVPGHRLTDKYAVLCGGGTNHRTGLYDMFLIKDNHIAAAGSITGAINKCREYALAQGLSVKVEIEVDTLEQFREAWSANPDIIMLDNFSANNIKTAVTLNQGKCKLEISGGVEIESLPVLAKLGVDYISSGALTHSVRALDISLEITG